MLKKLKAKLQARAKYSKTSKVQVEKQDNFRESYDTQMEAMALAEAGAHDLAQKAIVRDGMERPKILVVGREDIFTECVIDYAISLADRLGYDIIAMNVSTVMGHSGRFLSPFKMHLREEFEMRANEAVEVLREKAVAKGIHCEHVVRFSTLNKAVEELHHEIRRIEFVITEPEIQPDHPGIEVSIPVFSMQC